MRHHPSNTILRWAAAASPGACVRALADASTRHLETWGDGDRDALEDARTRILTCQVFASGRLTSADVRADCERRLAWPDRSRWMLGHQVDARRALIWGLTDQTSHAAWAADRGDRDTLVSSVGAGFDVCRQLGDDWPTVWRDVLNSEWDDTRHVRAGAHLAAAGLSDGSPGLDADAALLAALDDAAFEIACGLCDGWDRSTHELVDAAVSLTGTR